MGRSWKETLRRWPRSLVVSGAFSVVTALTLTVASAGMADDHRKVSKPAEKIAATHGTASGDITDKSAVIWSRASGKARMYVEYGTDPKLKHPKVQKTYIRVVSTSPLSLYSGSLRSPIVTLNQPVSTSASMAKRST